MVSCVFRTGLAIVLGVITLSPGVLPSSRALAAESAIDFGRDIRPILSENCFFCHGPDSGDRQAGLRLDVREAAIDHGAIVAGDVDASELISRLDETDPDLLMPPPESHKKLTDDEKELLRRWVQEGAVYQQHWSFQPLDRSSVKASSASVVDQFIQSRLSDLSVEMSPLARPERLVRRLHLDVVGLPPTWADVKRFKFAFEADPASAIASEVDRLLQSPHYGERMASVWLDVVRYADTVGFHGDQNQNIFPYRDWVVEAFNRNLPFDEFTRKQIAGDLIPGATTEDRVASGFNRLNMMTREGGAQPGEYLAKYAADRVRTVGMAWLGMTTGCAECHDHKFDPLTTKDFYSLGSFFADVEQWGVYNDYGYTPNPDLKGFSNEFPFPPEIEVVSEPLRRRQLQLRRELASLAIDQLRELRSGEANADIRQAPDRWWQATSRWLMEHPSGWATCDAIEQPQDPKSNSTRSFDLQTMQENRWVSLRVDLDLPANSASRRVEIRLLKKGADGKVQSLPLRRGDANRFLPRFKSTAAVHDVAGQWSVPATDAEGRVRRERTHQY
ncbi:MAG: DUF1549 domain-containing protein, partial [Planctomycetota bacterium]